MGEEDGVLPAAGWVHPARHLSSRRHYRKGSHHSRRARVGRKGAGATGLSQAAFARLLGVSVRTLQEWEQGRKVPSGLRHTAEGGGKASRILKGLAA